MTPEQTGESPQDDARYQPRVRVAGLDGCKAGWVAIVLDEGRFADALIAPTAKEILAAVPDATALAIDIPIGFPEGAAPRACDLEARKVLTGAASTVFPTLPRSVLEASTYEVALETYRALASKGLSKQSFELRHKILEIDALAASDDRVFEIHPEVCFRKLAGQKLPSKKTWNGEQVRTSLLADIGITIPDDLGAAGAAAPDDVLDAAVAAWSAHRYARGEAVSLPDPPERDAAGRRVAIWY